jgi:hypothetical protein
LIIILVIPIDALYRSISLKEQNMKELGEEVNYEDLAEYYKERIKLDKEVLKIRMTNLGLDYSDENLEHVIKNLEPEVKLREILPDTYEHSYYVK